MLKVLAEYFQCGTISVDNKENKTLRYLVNNKLDIETKIIPHFLNYPLVTSKKLNFNSFNKAFDIFKKGEHLTPEGFSLIVSLKNEMNKSRSFEDKFASSWSESNNITLHPAWVQGFADGEGSFGAHLTINNRSRVENVLEVQIKTDFNISQNIYDIAVMHYIQKFFNNKGFITPKLKDMTNLEEVLSSGKIASKYVLSDNNLIIEFFDKYPLLTSKQLDFLDFKNFVFLKNSKKHLTKEGFVEMLNLIEGMNTGRFGITKRKKTIIPEWNNDTKVIIK